MTIIEAINKVDELKANGYSQSEKVCWLSVIDSSIKRNIIDTHEDGEDITFNGYDDDTPLDTVLLAYAPFDEMYPHYLAAKIDYFNGEYTGYNNNIMNFNAINDSFINDYNRHHMPKGKKIKYM